MAKKMTDADWDKLRQIATDLKRADTGFWKGFKEIGALTAWLYYRGRCVYCGRELVQQGQLIGGAVTADHLLPRAKTKIGFSSHFNAVPACAACNSIKAVWDRNRKTSDSPAELNQSLHDELLSEAKKFVQSERSKAEARFESERANWLSALERRDALDR